MPEVNLKVKWPDNAVSDVYSPSTIVCQYFTEGDSMTVKEFVSKCTTALEHASKRVEERYGYACTSAMSSIYTVQSIAKDQEGDKTVEILELT
ncbi:MSMEG_0570 family nitrogen starvation response protein [Reichenbachiella versicolor]|uniref:MSMEG_0570 family nitrogen starvation response protein n=1 Tax=Reichenbachiella versicolor TaxID=1821036 RepID=UPI000D6E219C|nr:MSMEG_0570 family nitrogen starvation response protein [Reichenbachiella versicolor]